MNKTCRRCNSEQPIEQFNFKNKARGTRQSYCKACQMAYTMDHYKRNSQPYKDRAKKQRSNMYERIMGHLTTHPCVDCGESDPVVLDFDHKEPDQKSGNIGQMIVDGKSLKILEAEIAKCEVRCANCHRRRTAKQFGWRKLKFASVV